ncbi:hypothetical protein MNB_SUP05-5-269 [hydrothermal vent metagenome]|uniref:Uncharacterized protein n=1 Tax=hydrothermal vent metagenome TaxID=652676 RepID=A0A1W1CIC2_9ZZZZ
MFNYIKQNKKESILDRFIKTPLHTWLYPKIYFKEWQPTSGVGDNQYIDECYFSNPEHIIHNITKPTFKLEKDYFVYQSNFIKKLLTDIKNNLLDLDVVLLLEYPENKINHQKYIKKIIAICKKLSNKKIALKKHPRDFNTYDELINLKNTTFLPNIAFEFLLPFINKNTIILSGISTSLMLANTLLKNQTYLTTSANFQNSNLMQKLGVKNYE